MPSTDSPPGYSRRTLITISIATAAGLALETTAEHFIPSTDLRPLVEHGAWIALANLAAIPPGTALRFTTIAVIGWLLRNSDGTFLALSGVCTHMGCLVQWNHTVQQFDCPCHQGHFDVQGHPIGTTRHIATDLPTLRTRIQDDQVWVFVPDV